VRYGADPSLSVTGDGTVRTLLLAVIGIILVAPAAVADGMRLAGSLWQCTRLVEEENTDQILSELAEDAINPAAAT
jgi:hypothetical protein